MNFIICLTSRQKTHNVPPTIRVALDITLHIRVLVMIGCVTSRGGFFMTSRSTGSTPKLRENRRQTKINLFEYFLCRVTCAQNTKMTVIDRNEEVWSGTPKSCCLKLSHIALITVTIWHKLLPVESRALIG